MEQRALTIEERDKPQWQARKHVSGGTAYTRGHWQIIEHKTSGINLYAFGVLASVGFRSVEAAKNHVSKLENAL